MVVSRDLTRVVYESELDFTNRDKVAVTCTVWESKAGPSGRWYYRATREITLGEDDFVLHYFNSDCGIFHETLRLPTCEWNWMEERNAKIIKELFDQSVI